MRTPITLDRRRPLPLHRQIYEEWRQGILSGRFAAGERLPSTRELAVALGVSRASVTAAYDQLLAEGYVDGRRGSGTFVADDLPQSPLVTTRRGRRAHPEPPPLTAFVRRLRPIPRRPPVLPGVVDLSRSGPDYDLFPFAVWSRLVRRHLRRVSPSVFRYSQNAAGHDGLRETIAAYLRRSRAVRCSGSQVVVVSGSQQALDLCGRVLVDAGDAVVIEEPGYNGARHLFAAMGARLVPVPVDVDGVTPGAFPSAARIAYVTPSHQFPTGVSLSLARRLELLAWSQAARAWVIEDDYDSEFRYDGAPLPALQGLDQHGRVVYVGTFSNAMFPGLRIGYIVVPETLIEPFVRAKWYADRQTAYLEQAALADFIREGFFEQHIRRMRRIYKSRREALLTALERHFGPRAIIIGEAAGMHLLVRFAAPDIVAIAGRRGVGLLDTASYYTATPPPGECILRFAGLGEKALAEGVRRLARIAGSI